VWKCEDCETENEDFLDICSACGSEGGKVPSETQTDTTRSSGNEKRGNTYERKGHALKCPVCGEDKFWTRKTLMNTAGATFLGVEWANKQAENFICENCDYVFWFLAKKK